MPTGFLPGNKLRDKVHSRAQGRTQGIAIGRARSARMPRKLLSAALAAVLCLSAARFPAAATDVLRGKPDAPSILSGAGQLSEPAAPEVAGGACGENAFWSYRSDGTLYLTGSGPLRSFYDFDNVLEQIPWSAYLAEIDRIFFEDGLTTVPDRAFQGCAVETVRLPAGLETIGHFAFLNCAGLREIDFPAGLQSIGNSAFDGTGLTAARFYGDGFPEAVQGASHSFASFPEGVTLYYLDGREHWTDAACYDPGAGTWMGYPLASWGSLVYFAAGGGVMETLTVPAGETLVLPECGFDPPEGARFCGWRIGEEAYPAGATVQPTAALTVTAQWEERPLTVRFLDGSGAELLLREQSSGAGATPPELSDFVADGWFLPDGSPWDFSAPVTGDLDLRAGVSLRVTAEGGALSWRVSAARDRDLYLILAEYEDESHLRGTALRTLHVPAEGSREGVWHPDSGARCALFLVRQDNLAPLCPELRCYPHEQ